MSSDESGEIVNATIVSADIVIEMGFILSSRISVDYGDGTTQGFGGITLYLGPEATKHEESKKKNSAGIYIFSLMEIAGVEQFSNILDKNIRVVRDRKTGIIREIGHITKPIWIGL